ncbi:MAG: hypothetical protein MK098_08340 [Marinovum sp.]|nr:hypothetical protein [Marinovum sp.]
MSLTMPIKIGVPLIVGLTLAACGDESRNMTFDGERFRGGAKAVDRKDRSEFIATVRQVAKSEDGARQAIAYQATKYCIRWFGHSVVEWDTPPDSEILPISNDVLTLTGRCVE